MTSKCGRFKHLSAGLFGIENYLEDISKKN